MQAERTLIVSERTGSWGVAIRQLLDRGAHQGEEPAAGMATAVSPGAPLSPRLVETRSPDECLTELQGAPRGVVLIELSGSTADAALGLIAEIRMRFPVSVVIVAASHALASYELLARELGAVHFVSSPRSLPEVVGIAKRHWDRLPPPAMGTAESVLSTLPW